MNIENRIKRAQIDETNKDLLTKFDKELVASNSGISIHTRSFYSEALINFAKFISKPLKNATKEDIIAYINFLKENNYKDGTIVLYKVSTKRFYQWLFNMQRGEYPEVIKWLKVQRKKTTKLPDEMLTLEDIGKLIDTCDNHRDKALLSLFYESAGRASEILNLKLRDYRPDEFGATIQVTGKTGQRRIRIVNSVVYIREWLDLHPKKDNPEFPLFLNKYHPYKKIDYQNFIKLLHKISKKSGIKKKIYPHLFRHSRLTHLVKLGLNESELRAYAGWVGDSQMTRTYVHLSGRDIDDKILSLYNLKNINEKKEMNLPVPRKCPRCNELNEPTAEFCHKCWLILDPKRAFEFDRKLKVLEELLRNIPERVLKKAAEKRAASMKK